jgi:hypothetical protein
MTESRNLGVQPLKDVMLQLGITSHDLTAASTQQLTYKVVAKGCKGRKLTLNAQHKILQALHALRPEKNLTLKDLFNY